MLKKLSLICMIIAMAAFLMTGCGKKNKDEDADDSGARSSKPEYKATGNEATITGTISFTGEPPAPKKIDMGADPNCASSGGEKTTDDLIVTGGKLANVFVYVKGGPVDKNSFKPSSEAVTLDQQGCRYHPRVLGVQVGQTLRVTNSDPTTHNVHPTPSNNPEWNQSQSPNAAPIEKKFNKAETLIPVKCNVHPWMRANVGVLAHPFFAVTDKDGKFTINGLPPGDYTLVAWHETKGEQTQKITVGAKETKTQDFTYATGTAYAPTSLKVDTALVLPRL